MPLAHATTAAGSTAAWSVDPVLLLALTVAVIGWALAVRSIDAAHPRTPVPRARTIAFVAGIVALLVALQSPIDTLADELFSVHMVQHLLLSYVAAPLFVLAGPGLLLLRAAPGAPRRRFVLPLLRSRPVRILTFPVLTWLAFPAVMWIVHFSPLFELSLESEPIHELEHLLFLVSGFLYWLPAIGDEPLSTRLSWSSRFLYLFLGMPFSSVLGLVVVAQSRVLYPAYVVAAGSGTDALADQRLAGTIMWVGADLIAFVLLAVLTWSWIRAESIRMGRRTPHRIGR